MSEQKICPTCGTEYPLSERFCPRDGTALRSSNASADLLGSVVADRYHVIKKLGEGGMGTVYLAEHVKMGRKSALKVMNPGMNTDPEAIARFNREAANASRLNHPNICAIYDFGETPDGMIYLAMEFIEGSSLTSLIERSGALPAPRCGHIIHQAADALQVAHDAGIVHRDLKPDNIMIARSRDGGDLVKVVDFGIAKASASDAQKVTRTGLVVGTPEYMSPEQLAGDTLDGRSDTYSLGLVAYNCLTGTLPFPAETAQEAMILRLTDRPRTLAEARPDLEWPAELQRVMDRALARDAADRYASAAQFGREFAAAIAAMPATQAAEAGTVVMGAARTAPVPAASPVAVPPTRVRPSAGTQPMEAPAAAPPRREPARPAAAPARSPLLPVLGGVGGLAVVGYLVWVMMFKPPATPASGDPGAASAATQADPRTAAPPSTDDTSALAAGPDSTPRDAAGTAPTPQPLNRPIVNTPAGTTSGTTGGTTGGSAPGPATAPTTQKMPGWISRLDVGAVSEDQARGILNELDPVMESLQGDQLADAWYVKMMALAVLGDQKEACDAASQVERRQRNAERRGTATRFRSEASCS